MHNEKIIVIGSGAAGLMVAKELSSKFHVTIVEAEHYAGGRIITASMDNNIIEGGAEFIHGNLPVTMKLLRDADIKYTAVTGKMYRHSQNGLVQQNEIIGG